MGDWGGQLLVAGVKVAKMPILSFVFLYTGEEIDTRTYAHCIPEPHAELLNYFAWVNRSVEK